MRNANIEFTLNNKDIDKVIGEIWTDNNYAADRIIIDVFKKYPGNTLGEFVLPKVTILNALYSTQIYDV